MLLKISEHQVLEADDKSLDNFLTFKDSAIDISRNSQAYINMLLSEKHKKVSMNCTTNNYYSLEVY